MTDNLNCPAARLHIEYCATDSLTPNKRNARKHSDRNVAQLAASIAQFGFKSVIVVDESNCILAGHGRWKAAVQLGMPEVPITRVHFPSEQQRRAFALADNRLAELSEWDETLLSEELKFLFEDGFELNIAGFSTADLDFALPEQEQPDAGLEQNELPDLNVVAISQVGDLWQIGPHRLICGDARDPQVWEQLLWDELVTLVFGDLPYNVPIHGHVSGNGKNKHREFACASGEMSPAEFIVFLRTIFRNCARFSTNGSIHYQCMDFRHAREILDAADGVYSQFKQLIVWDKGVGGQSAFYRSQHELVFVFKSGTGRHINNFGMGGKRYRTNVVKIPGANSFHKGRDADLQSHPTTKPIPLVADFLLDCSNRGDAIADPTVGSGTTLIAAHRTGRRGRGIELDPLYVDTAVRRLSQASGLTAVLDGDGRTFEEIAARRSSERED